MACGPCECGALGRHRPRRESGERRKMAFLTLLGGDRAAEGQDRRSCASNLTVRSCSLGHGLIPQERIEERGTMSCGQAASGVCGPEETLHGNRSGIVPSLDLGIHDPEPELARLWEFSVTLGSSPLHKCCLPRQGRLFRWPKGLLVSSRQDCLLPPQQEYFVPALTNLGAAKWLCTTYLIPVHLNLNSYMWAVTMQF